MFVAYNMMGISKSLNKWFSFCENKMNDVAICAIPYVKIGSTEFQG